MVEAGFRSLHAEEDVMVDISLAAIDAVEGRDHVALVVAENLIAWDEAQHLAIPGERFLKIDADDDAVTEPLHRHRPGGEAGQRAEASVARLRGVDDVLRQRQRI